ncbi:MAG: hypothetical protein AAGI91_15960 [Bacteroidota bacterium]
MLRLPFTLPEDGLREIKGFVSLDLEFVVLEVETAIAGILGKEETTIKVAPSALDDAWLKTGLVRDRLCLAPSKVDLLKAVPGDHAREIALRIPRKYRLDTEDLVDELSRRIDAA